MSVLSERLKIRRDQWKWLLREGKWVASLGGCPKELPSHSPPDLAFAHCAQLKVIRDVCHAMQPQLCPRPIQSPTFQITNVQKFSELNASPMTFSQGVVADS